MIEKIEEILEHIWIKILVSIPACFLIVKDNEKEMLWGFGLLLVIDTILGVFCAAKKKEFDFGTMGKKTAKKFSLYFIALGLAFITARIYDFLDFLFYWLGTVLFISELGSSFKKLNCLGLKIPIQGILDNALSNFKLTK